MECQSLQVLATKMSAFHEELEIPTQYKIIYAGVAYCERFLGQCQRGEKELHLGEMKEIMDDDGFGKMLWEHLDEEVRHLPAENMKWCSSPAEMRGL